MPDRAVTEAYSPSRGRPRVCRRRYNSDDSDRSSSPDIPGPRAFDRTIRGALFPPRFRAPTHITKYSGDTNPSVWLEDYCLACRVGGADDDLFIIQYLPIFLADSARAWLEYLPGGCIRDWADLRSIFVGNFQGTYTRPGNSWDLKSCRQRTGETLRDYSKRFSKKCNELPGVDDSDVVGAFISGTNCESLVHKLGCKKPRTIADVTAHMQ